MKKPQKWLATVAAATCLIQSFGWTGVAERSDASIKISETSLKTTADIPEYGDYIRQHTGVGSATDSLVLSAQDAQISVTGPEFQHSFKGKKDVLIWKQSGGTASWTITVPSEGLYTLNMAYYALPGKQTDIQMALTINGTLPFRQASSFRFARSFQDVYSNNGRFEKDKQGNEIKPRTEEVFLWQTSFFLDADGLYSQPLTVYLKAGKNTLTLENRMEPVAISQLTLSSPQVLPDYDSLRITPKKFTENIPQLLKIPAEILKRKTHASITVGYDKSTPVTEPYNSSKICMNTLGGSRWKNIGEQVTWEFNVERSGYYYIGSRYRQNTVRGFYVSRSILLDDRPICSELQQQRFYYDIQWRTEHFGTSERPMVFYLEKGKHTLTMTATLGSMTETIRQVDEAQRKLNEMYRKIIMITSVQPDPYRDYSLETDIPELLSVLSSVSESLKTERVRLEKITGNHGSEAVLMDRLAEQLDSFVRQPYTIASRLSKFRENVSGLAEWMNRIKEQPLELDYLYLCPYGEEKPAATAGFFEQAWHEIRSFLGTFFEDYNHISDDGEGRNIEVWVASGRDAAYALNRMVNDSFTRKTGININLKLVQGALLQAIMSGREPDVALTLGRGEPVNLAMRGALEPLSSFPDYQDITTQFHKDAMIPYTFDGKVYALPEQQLFHMMFVRTDIFAELGLAIPDTWDELYHVAKILQRNNLQVGLPYLQTDAYNIVSTGMSAQNIFPTLLVQRGGSIFSADHQSTALDTPEALEAFEEWVDFYTQYSFPLFKDDYNRFRTGEMPLTITMYTFFNQLVMAAPEIRNEWSMVRIPGIRQADGSINRAECASGTGAVLLADRPNKAEGWEFLKWWISAESQVEYGLQMEALLGSAGRYATANQEAFDRLPWQEEDAEKIRLQWREVTEIPEVPGGYYVSRNLDNAFRACVYRKENKRELLGYWNKSSNDEIRRKREEFHLN